jgi:hypothetical protein
VNNKTKGRAKAATNLYANDLRDLDLRAKSTGFLTVCEAGQFMPQD